MLSTPLQQAFLFFFLFSFFFSVHTSTTDGALQTFTPSSQSVYLFALWSIHIMLMYVSSGDARCRGGDAAPVWAGRDGFEVAGCPQEERPRLRPEIRLSRRQRCDPGRTRLYTIVLLCVLHAPSLLALAEPGSNDWTGTRGTLSCSARCVYGVAPSPCGPTGRQRFRLRAVRRP